MQDCFTIILQFAPLDIVLKCRWLCREVSAAANRELKLPARSQEFMSNVQNTSKKMLMEFLNEPAVIFTLTPHHLGFHFLSSNLSIRSNTTVFIRNTGNKVQTDIKRYFRRTGYYVQTNNKWYRCDDYEGHLNVDYTISKIVFIKPEINEHLTLTTAAALYSEKLK